MSRLIWKFKLIVIVVIYDAYAQFNSGGSESVSAGSSGASGGTGSTGESGSTGGSGLTGGSSSSGGGSGASGASGLAGTSSGGARAGSGIIQPSHLKQACWMRAEDFLNNFNGPQGWEFNQPVYAEEDDCSTNPDPGCIGISKFYPETDTKNSDSWKDRKVLYYPFGLVNWADLSTGQSSQRPLIVGKNGYGRKMTLCRHFSKFQQYTIGIHAEGQPSCVMNSAETGAQISQSTFETLVITSSGDNSGLDPNVLPCSRVYSESCNEDSRLRFMSMSDPTAAHLNEICWLSHTVNRLHFPAGDPIGVEDSNVAYLVRVIWTGNKNGRVAFGKLLVPRHKIYIIGCDAPLIPDSAAVEVLRLPQGKETIYWRETNSTEMLCGFPDYALILGELPGKPYALGKRSSYHTICQPEILQDKSEKLLLGMVSSETGYCEAVFKNQIVHYNKFWIPMQDQQRKGMITKLCLKGSLPGESLQRDIAARTERKRRSFNLLNSLDKLLKSLGELPLSEWDEACTANKENGVMKFDGYSVAHHSKFQIVNSACLDKFERHEIYDTYHG